MRIWMESEMKDLVQSNDKVLYGALKALYGEQTAEEQASFGTTETNGRGFSKIDAEFLTSCAQFLINRGFLTDKQKAVVRKKLVKYNKQITKLANAFESQKETPVEAFGDLVHQQCWNPETKEFDYDQYQYLCGAFGECQE